MATAGLSEAQALSRLAGDLDVYVSRFRPMKNTLSGREERTFMKMLVHVQSDKVRARAPPQGHAARLLGGQGAHRCCSCRRRL
jgi:pyruvate/2-oxoglutarate dehydrogenase complex dihydrolipoamide dehydrogenase (E3) component